MVQKRYFLEMVFYWFECMIKLWLMDFMWKTVAQWVRDGKIYVLATFGSSCILQRCTVRTKVHVFYSYIPFEDKSLDVCTVHTAVFGTAVAQHAQRFNSYANNIKCNWIDSNCRIGFAREIYGHCSNLHWKKSASNRVRWRWKMLWKKRWVNTSFALFDITSDKNWIQF